MVCRQSGFYTPRSCKLCIIISPVVNGHDIGVFFNKVFSFVSPCDVDRDVSTAYCQSSSGDEVDRCCVTLQSRMVRCDWLVFSSCDWCVSILAVTVYCSLGGLLSHGSSVVVFLIVGIFASGLSLPLSVMMLLGWSYVNRFKI